MKALLIAAAIVMANITSVSLASTGASTVGVIDGVADQIIDRYRTKRGRSR